MDPKKGTIFGSNFGTQKFRLEVGSGKNKYHQDIILGAIAASFAADLRGPSPRSWKGTPPSAEEMCQ